MISEIMIDCYDVEGRKVFRPDSHRRGAFRPTFPPGRYLSQPLEHWCSNFKEMSTFLRSCKTFFKDGKWYLLEPLASAAGTKRPQLSIAAYKPKFSMAWDGKNIA